MTHSTSISVSYNLYQNSFSLSLTNTISLSHTHTLSCSIQHFTNFKYLSHLSTSICQPQVCEIPNWPRSQEITFLITSSPLKTFESKLLRITIRTKYIEGTVSIHRYIYEYCYTVFYRCPCVWSSK